MEEKEKNGGNHTLFLHVPWRFAEHKGYVKNKHLNQATGSHFNEPGHGLENKKVIIIEKSKQANEPFRKEREKFFIQKFNTFKP